MQINNNWFFLLILVFSTSAYAQQALLSKEEAVARALESNYGIKISLNEVEIAENNAGILNSGYLPSVSGQAGASYDRNDRLTEPEEGDIVEQNNIENSGYRGSVGIDYLLFDGLGRYYNYKSLKEEFDLSKLEARETIENTILQLFSVYYEIARLYENIDVLKETLEISRERVTRAKYQFDYGQANNLAVLNARVDVNSDSINLLQARQELANTKRDLNVLLKREMDSRDYMVDTTVNFIAPLKLTAMIEEADENNVRLLQVEKAIDISEYAIRISKSQLLPSVGLSGSYGWNRNRSAASAFFPGSRTTTSGFSGGVSLSWDIFNSGRSIVDVKNARIVNTTQELLKEQLILEVKRDIANAFGTYENKLFIYRVQEDNVLTNLNNFDRTAEQYKLGQISSIEFRQAQINLLNARTALNLAKYDAKLAEIQLLKLTGTLLDIEL